MIFRATKRLAEAEAFQAEREREIKAEREEIARTLQDLSAISAGQFMSVVAHAGHDGEMLSAFPGLRQSVTALADTLVNQSTKNLDTLVELSMNNCEAGIGAGKLLESSRTQARDAHAIAAASTEMAASIAVIRDASSAASSDAECLNSTMESTGVDIREVSNAMDNIAGSVKQTSNQIMDLNSAAREIEDILQTIDTIAKRTNLLALNASIEAARAGETGKGFAVVATEVKHLAAQTSTATVEIRSRIDRLQQEMTRISDLMDKCVDAVGVGTNRMALLAERFSDGGQRAVSVCARMNEVANILAQQTTAVEEVSSGISKIADVANSNVQAVTRLTDAIGGNDAKISAALNAMAASDFPGKVVRLACADHVMWKKRLIDMSVGRTKLNAAELADHRSCRLGKWYYGQGGTEFAGEKSFVELEGCHEAVHRHGIEAARRFNAGDVQGALTEIERVDEASQIVLQRLDELKRTPRR